MPHLFPPFSLSVVVDGEIIQPCKLWPCHARGHCSSMQPLNAIGAFGCAKLQRRIGRLRRDRSDAPGAFSLLASQKQRRWDHDCAIHCSRMIPEWNDRSVRKCGVKACDVLDCRPSVVSFFVSTGLPHGSSHRSRISLHSPR